MQPLGVAAFALGIQVLRALHELVDELLGFAVVHEEKRCPAHASELEKGVFVIAATVRLRQHVFHTGERVADLVDVPVRDHGLHVSTDPVTCTTHHHSFLRRRP